MKMKMTILKEQFIWMCEENNDFIVFHQVLKSVLKVVKFIWNSMVRNKIFQLKTIEEFELNSQMIALLIKTKPFLSKPFLSTILFT